MRWTRKKFVLVFLACGHTFHFLTKHVLNGPSASTLLAPLKAVLFGPIDWLQQDPDPPPPFRLILLTAYWSALALAAHYLLSRKAARA
jgi:hypothetical protein